MEAFINLDKFRIEVSRKYPNYTDNFYITFDFIREVSDEMILETILRRDKKALEVSNQLGKE